jgi:hypothetical protein
MLGQLDHERLGIPVPVPEIAHAARLPRIGEPAEEKIRAVEKEHVGIEKKSPAGLTYMDIG